MERYWSLVTLFCLVIIAILPLRQLARTFLRMRLIRLGYRPALYSWGSELAWLTTVSLPAATCCDTSAGIS